MLESTVRRIERHLRRRGLLGIDEDDGCTLHAATRAGASHPGGREALLRYVLRPPIAQERLGAPGMSRPEEGC